jgi:hypothetical protein
VTHAGAVVNQTTVDSLQLAGRPTQTAFPVMGNVNGVTVASSQVDTPFELGHFVVFDRPDVQRQVVCLLDGVGTPDGPQLRAPEVSCP